MSLISRNYWVITVKISIIIPTLNAQRCLPDLLDSLSSQSIDNKEIIIIDSGSVDKTTKIALSYGAHVQSIEVGEFNHGRTRNIAAQKAKGKYLVFLTQDALPVNDRMLENLVTPLEKDNKIAVAYGRQIAYNDACTIEKIVRAFNYPESSITRDKYDIENLGVKTFFCSNACAIYRTGVFRQYKGFRDNTIMNEDMEFVYRVVMSGYRVQYAAGAVVWHSHDYTFFEQFKRYVDIGVFFAENRSLAACSDNESEGVKYIKHAMGRLYQDRQCAAFADLLIDSLARFLGYNVGVRYALLPARFMRYISMNRNYWAS